jgi:hypothetical protein
MQIGDRNVFDRRLAQEEVSDGNVYGVREALELLERRSSLTPFPGLETREAIAQHIDIKAGAPTSPPQQFWLDLDTHHPEKPLVPIL